MRCLRQKCYKLPKEQPPGYAAGIYLGNSDGTVPPCGADVETMGGKVVAFYFLCKGESKNQCVPPFSSMQSIRLLNYFRIRKSFNLCCFFPSSSHFPPPYYFHRCHTSFAVPVCFSGAIVDTCEIKNLTGGDKDTSMKKSLKIIKCLCVYKYIASTSQRSFDSKPIPSVCAVRVHTLLEHSSKIKIRLLPSVEVVVCLPLRLMFKPSIS